ncbi:MAG: NAD(P)/FAD-dependent oxidoreductase [Clostridia bacterium]|nr:NAD(P)/FAD-dependent oxidoreductase [Clostridia bacterium]
MSVIIVGGGPAGMIAAIAASKSGEQVTLLEKNSQLGKKLLITGKGRCNITSSLPMDDFIKNVPGNGKFLYSALQNYTNQDIIEMLEQNGVKVKEERGNRIFPVSNRAIDVRDAMEKVLKQNHVTIKLGATVKDILQQNGQVVGVKLQNGETLEADKIIIATGGKSYPGTGSTGDGYRLAERLGHHITEVRPSLVPLIANSSGRKICKKMQGLSLRNVAIKFKDVQDGKVIYEDFGEMLFTHEGVSGPTILSGSAHLLRYKNVDELLRDNKIQLIIDLKPALSEEKLDARILRDFAEEKNKLFKNSLDKLLPKKMIDVIVALSRIEGNKMVNEVTKKEREALVFLLKHFEITLSQFGTIEEAIVTSGGISTKEINPKTMESKLVKGLYFAGEVIDVDAYTGGFNLQIAYSTGYTAGTFF